MCCVDDRVREVLRAALSAAGHEIAAGASPAPLADGASAAGALLVDPPQARRSVAVLRDRGFGGRAVLASSEQRDDLAGKATELGLDGALCTVPPEDLARRFALAVGGKRRILVVDDSEDAGRLLAAELGQAGYDARTVASAEEAMSLILKRATRPDLVLVDVELPRVSGAQLCRFLKSHERFRAIKVVLCAGAGRAEAEALAAECGADDVVTRAALLGDQREGA